MTGAGGGGGITTHEDGCKHCGACKQHDRCDHCGHCRKCGKRVDLAPHQPWPLQPWTVPITPTVPYPTFPNGQWWIEPYRITCASTYVINGKPDNATYTITN